MYFLFEDVNGCPRVICACPKPLVRKKWNSIPKNQSLKSKDFTPMF